MRIRVVIVGVIIVACCSYASAQKCLEYGPTVSLEGKLRSQVFAGPPNYESIKRGDRKETAVIVTLARRTCTTGNDPNGFEVSEKGIREMQLVVTRPEDWKIVRRQMGKRVTVTGTLFHAATGHHRTKVLIFVKTIREG